MERERRVHGTYQVVGTIETVRSAIAKVEATKHSMLGENASQAANDSNRSVTALRSAAERLDGLLRTPEQRRQPEGLRPMLVRALAGADNFSATENLVDEVRSAETSQLRDHKEIDA